MATGGVFMSSKRYTDKFRREAVKQVSERGHKVADVAARLGVSTYSLYDWIRKYGPSSDEYQAEGDQQAEIRRLKADLKCGTAGNRQHLATNNNNSFMTLQRSFGCHLLYLLAIICPQMRHEICPLPAPLCTNPFAEALRLDRQIVVHTAPPGVVM